jgi:hypothetical protein
MGARAMKITVVGAAVIIVAAIVVILIARSVSSEKVGPE